MIRPLLGPQPTSCLMDHSFQHLEAWNAIIDLWGIIHRPVLAYFSYFVKNISRLMRSRYCMCLCLLIPPIVARKRLGKTPLIVARQRLGISLLIFARQRLGKNFLIVARQQLGKSPLIFARQRLGKNPPIVARQRLGKNPLIVARQRLGKNPPIVARQRLGKNPPIVVRQRLGRNVTAVRNTHATIEELLYASFSMWPVLYQGK
jgi:hypothetical protein